MFIISVIANFANMHNWIDTDGADPGWQTQATTRHPNHNHLQHGVQKGNPVSCPVQFALVSLKQAENILHEKSYFVIQE